MQSVLEARVELSAGRESKETVEVRIRYKNHELEVKGEPGAVVNQMLQFFSKVLPQLELLSQLTLSIDIQRLLEACVNILSVTPEGVVVRVDTSALKDQERIMLHLVKKRLGFMIGRVDRDTMTTSEIVSATSGKAGTVAGRLSELVSEDLAERASKGEYRITTLGLDHFIENIAPILRQKEDERR